MSSLLLPLDHAFTNKICEVTTMKLSSHAPPVCSTSATGQNIHASAKLSRTHSLPNPSLLSSLTWPPIYSDGLLS